MTKTPIWRSHAAACWLLLAAFAAPGVAQDADSARSAEEASSFQTLYRMASVLTRHERLSVDMDISFDVVQKDGRKLEFGLERSFVLARPDRFRIDVVTRDGRQRGTRYDGETLTVFSVQEKVHAQVERKGSYDDLVSHLTDVLGHPVPLSRLFSAKLPEFLEEEAMGVTWVEEAVVDGVLCEHLAVGFEGVDVQVWVQKGAQALPQRMVLTYLTAPGQPQFRAAFANWDLSPRVSNRDFEYASDPDSELIRFLPASQGQ